MILEDSSSNSSDDNVVFGMNGLGDDGMKGLEDDGLEDDVLGDDGVNPVVDVITDDSVDTSDETDVDKVDVDVLIPKSKIVFLLF